MIFLNELEKMSLNIENLRQEMHELMEKEHHIISPEIIIISQELDELIIKYNNIRKEML